jgi:hypothetical protein
MDDTATIVGENVEVVPTGAENVWGAISWSAVIAGALAALAVAFIVVSLGSGIGLAVASPYGSGPSATTLTIAGAVWLVLAQAVGYAVGGYVAGRVRNDLVAGPDEARFRDRTHGLVAWAIGVAATGIVLVSLAAMSAGPVARAGAGLAGGPESIAATERTPAEGYGTTNPIAYYVDLLLRAAPPHDQAQNGAVPRDQVARIMLNAVRQGGLSADDRNYLAAVVAAETGVSAQDAQRRVDDVTNRAKESMQATADNARKAASFLSFWTFMSLLFGAVAAVLGGVLGGEQRDEAMAGIRPLAIAR